MMNYFIIFFYQTSKHLTGFGCGKSQNKFCDHILVKKIYLLRLLVIYGNSAYCSANVEAMGSNPVDALKFFSGLFCNCFNR